MHNPCKNLFSTGKMVVVSAEGPKHVDKRNWCAHVILGVFETRQEAIEFFQEYDRDEDELVFMSDLYGTINLADGE